MQEHDAHRKVPSLTLLCSQPLSSRRAYELGLKFMTHVVSSAQCPEWNGYNTHHERSSGVMHGPKAKAVYSPLINKTPSSPSTMLSTVDLLFYSPSYFQNVIPVLGGMHMLMASIHAICTIIFPAIRSILSTSSGSVDKIMFGKKYPQTSMY